MGNMMSLVTVVSENYPEKKWIKPVGYSVIGLTALSQLNNKHIGPVIFFWTGYWLHIRKNISFAQRTKDRS